MYAEIYKIKKKKNDIVAIKELRKQILGKF